MIAPEFPKNEKQRQAAVEKYQLLDTLPESEYDDITELVAYICDAPICLISLLDRDRNFLKSHHGIPFNESPRKLSFCGHAINSPDEITIVRDSREDERFAGNPLVADFQAIFYAGVPLVDPEGFKLGTLCVYDHKARELTPEQKNAMIILSRQVIKLFEQRYQNLKLMELQEGLKERNQDLEKFAHKVSHDLKSPLANIISLTEILETDFKKNMPEQSAEYFEYLKKSSLSLKNYIEGLLKFYKSDELIENKQEKTEISELRNDIQNLIGNNEDIQMSFSGKVKNLKINKSAIMQILLNLISNGLKYNSRNPRKIDVEIEEDRSFYNFRVSDNGNGIPVEYLDEIFNLFSVVGTDRNGNTGSGIGLATVKKLVNQLGGDIQVSSVVGLGSTFIFNVLKS